MHQLFIIQQLIKISTSLNQDIKITFLRLVYELEESFDFEDDSYGLQPFAPFLELDDRNDGIFHSSIIIS